MRVLLWLAVAVGVKVAENGQSAKAAARLQSFYHWAAFESGYLHVFLGPSHGFQVPHHFMAQTIGRVIAQAYLPLPLVCV